MHSNDRLLRIGEVVAMVCAERKFHIQRDAARAFPAADQGRGSRRQMVA